MIARLTLMVCTVAVSVNLSPVGLSMLTGSGTLSKPAQNLCTVNSPHTSSVLQVYGCVLR